MFASVYAFMCMYIHTHMLLLSRLLLEVHTPLLPGAAGLPEDEPSPLDTLNGASLASSFDERFIQAVCIAWGCGCVSFEKQSSNSADQAHIVK